MFDEWVLNYNTQHRALGLKKKKKEKRCEEIGVGRNIGLNVQNVQNFILLSRKW